MSCIFTVDHVACAHVMKYSTVNWYFAVKKERGEQRNGFDSLLNTKS